MPINKFGSHMLVQQQQQSQNQLISNNQTIASGFYICEPITYHSKCIITIRGSNEGMYLKYKLENSLTEYIFQISGKIESVTIVPETISVSLDDKTQHEKKYSKADSLVNKNIKKGDSLLFLKSESELSTSLFVELIIQCPLAKENE